MSVVTYIGYRKERGHTPALAARQRPLSSLVGRSHYSPYIGLISLKTKDEKCRDFGPDKSLHVAAGER